ncbi:MAG: biotin--[acetyl-CoA-carboxylase] ligase, partial [Elusimicrobia bacterium RIFOXYA1_FULL_47_7]
NGTPEGLLIIAESQSSGYGRLSRKWASPPLGLWFSLVLRPKLIPSNVPQLTLVFSLAICRALKRFRRINPEIKWPNDIFLGNKKLGGVITEMSAESDGVRWLVLGAGINVNNEIPRSLLDTAVSILAATGGAVDRAALLAGIINDFDAMYRTYTVSGFGGFAAEYNENSLLKGKRVTVDMLGEVISGTVLGIDDSGFLLVKRDNGETRKIIAGDVTLKGW